MASFLYNQSLLASCSCSSSLPSKRFQTLNPKILPFSPLSYPHLPRPSNLTILGFTTMSSLPCVFNRRTRFNSYASQDSVLPTTNDERNNTQNDVRVTDDEEHERPLPSLMALIESYKESTLNGDEKTLLQIEVRILSISTKKIELIKEVSTLSAEKSALKEKYLRLQADFDNFRKRSDKERLNIQSDAQQEVIEKLLLMVDNFERTKRQIKPATEKEKKIDASYQGIYKQFVEIMRSHHVAVLETVGKPFDPLLHEAIAREESQEFKEGIIIHETRRGFRHRGRILRPALVKVSLGPGNTNSTEASGKSKEQPSTPAGIDER